MRSGAKVLGIIGGVIGLIVGIFALVLGFLGSELLGGIFGGEAALAGAMITLWSVSIFVFGILGLAGGIMTKGKPLSAGILMLIGGLGGFFLSGMFWLVPGILLIIGGILSLVSLKQTA
jgi:hypothetical protein